MPRDRRQSRLLTASTAAAAALMLSACGTSFDAQTNQVYQPAEGANQRGEVDVMNTVLVADEDGAVLSAGAVNQLERATTITGVTVTTTDGTELEVQGPDSVLLPSRRIVTLGAADGDAVYSVADGIEAGQYATVTVTFAGAEPTVIEAPAVERTEMYGDVAEPAAPAGAGQNQSAQDEAGQAQAGE